ncbi:MFS transporter [Spirillospora sp. CA-253888]
MTRYSEVFGAGGFRVLFALQTLLMVGDTVRMLALSVLVFERTGSPLAAALVYGAGFLPYVLGGTLLLALADRTRARTLLTGFHLLRAAVTALLAGVGVPLPVVLALLLLVGVFAPVAAASANGLLPELLPGDGYVLGRSLLTMSAAASQIAGQGVGGVLLLAAGPRTALWAVAGSALGAAVLARFAMGDRPPRRVGNGAPVRETWRVNRRLLGDAGTRRLLLAQWSPISLAVGAEGVLIPYVAGIGRPGAAGIVLAAMASGLLLGNLVVGRFAAPALRERLALPLALAAGAPLLAFALRPGVALASVLWFLSAVGLSYELSLQRPFLDRVPEAHVGQALGLASMGLMTGQAAAIASAGALGEVLDAGTVTALCGAASMAASLALLRGAGGRNG